MIEQGMIQRINTEYYDKIQARYIPLAKADLTELKTSEKDVIDKVIEQMSQLFYFSWFINRKQINGRKNKTFEPFYTKTCKVL